jgi:PEP-CTERM motif
MIRRVSFILGFLVTLSALHATPSFYALSFNFTGGSGDTLPTGSFTYDSSLVSNPFSSFVVDAGGLVFDLTSSANSFAGDASLGACKSSNTPAGLFNALTAPGCEGGWDYLPNPGFTQLQIDVCSATFRCDDGSVTLSEAATGTGSVRGSGGQVTAAQATPEPGAIWLSGIGLLVLMGRGWSRRKHWRGSAVRKM